jgi:uncharacterized protein
MSSKKSLSKVELIFNTIGINIVRFHWILIITILVLGIAASIGLKDLRTSVSIKNLFLENDIVILEQKEFDSSFGNSDFIGLLIESPDVFSVETIRLIESISSDLKDNVTLIESVSSIFSFAGDINEESLNKTRDNLDMRLSVRGKLYSEDYKQAWIICSLKTYPSDEQWITEDNDPSYAIGQEVMKIVDKYQAMGVSVLATGIPVLEFRKSSEMLTDLIRVILLAAIIALILIILTIRSFTGVIGTLLVITISISSVFGVIGWLKMTIDTTFMLIPILLTIAVSIGYTIHIFNFFKRNLLLTGERKNSVIYSIKETGWPIMFTAFTTIFALITFILVPIRAIQWVGLVSAISITVVYIMTMLFFSSIISIGSDNKIVKEETKNVKNSRSGIDRFEVSIGKFSKIVLNHGKFLIVSFIIIIIVSGFGISKLKVDLNTRKMMGNKLQHAIDQNYISDSSIGATNAYSIALQFPEHNDALNYEILEKLDQLTDYINQEDYVKRTTSINSIIKEVNMQRNGNDEHFYIIPEKDSTIRGLVLTSKRLLEGSMDSWIDQDNKTLRILVEIYDVSTLKTKAHIDGLNNEIIRIFPKEDNPDFRYLLTGGVIQLSIMNQYITRGLIQSVISALIVISIMMMVVFRNFKLGLIAMIPNITPVIITGGLMGFMGEPLEFVTMTIAPMVMGLAVDDTIHFINHVKLDFTRIGHYEKSIKSSFIKVGKALILANVILCATFSAFIFSSVHSMVNMGIYMVVAMLTALIADFTVTPFIIKTTKPFGKELT